MYSQVLSSKIDKVLTVKETEIMLQLMYKETKISYIKPKTSKNFINRSKKQEKFIIMKMIHNSIKKLESIIS
jgi:hypothetical protein